MTLGNYYFKNYWGQAYRLVDVSNTFIGGYYGIELFIRGLFEDTLTLQKSLDPRLGKTPSMVIFTKLFKRLV